jgi:hypothetical protein
MCGLRLGTTPKPYSSAAVWNATTAAGGSTRNRALRRSTMVG